MVRGLRQRRPGKRSKSLSVVQISRSCSIASAARCASVVRLPPAPTARMKLKRIAGWRSPGWSTETCGLASQASTISQAADADRGFAASWRGGSLPDLLRACRSLQIVHEPIHFVEVEPGREPEVVRFDAKGLG